MASKTTTIQIRIDQDLKTEAKAVLDKMHISMSQAVKMFLGQVVNSKRLPLDLFVPNDETQQTINEVDAGIGLHEISNTEKLLEELDS